MNIDSSNLLAMLSVPDGIESFAHDLQDGSVLSGEFSEALLEKLKQLQELSSAGFKHNKLGLDASSAENSLHEIAGLLNNNKLLGAYPEFSGKSLPSESLNIDLEQTLESLTEVLESLQDTTGESELLSAEKKESRKLDLTPEVLKDKLESIKVGIEQQLSSNAPAEPSLEAAEPIKTLAQVDVTEQPLEADESIEILAQVENIIAKLEALQADSTDSGIGVLDLIADETAVTEVISEQVQPISDDLLEEILLAVPLIEQAVTEPGLSKNIKEIKQVIEQAITPARETPAKVEDELELISQLASLVSKETENQQSEKPVILTMPKQGAALKQGALEQSNGLSQNEELDSLLAEDEVVLKPKADEFSNAFLAKKQANPANQTQTATDPALDRSLPRFAADIAQMNRAILSENKADLPAMNKHFAHPEWGQEMGERIVWMHKRAIPSAELRLNPEHLGPIKIKIDVSQEQATVAFSAQHAAVKEAIDAALPKLRELFSTQQLNLAEVTVTQDEAGQKQPRGFSQAQGDGSQREKQPEEMTEQEQIAGVMDIVDEIEAGRAVASNGLLSIFA